MTKRRHAKGYRMDQHQGHKPDPVVRLVATHPSQQLVVVSVGSSLRMFNCETGEQIDILHEGHDHKGAVRFCTISADGQHLLTGSDDKTCKLWNMASRTCEASWRMHKKMSAGAFSQDSAYALFADKFGDVAVAATGASAAHASPSAEPELLLGHLCSFVSTVAVSPDNKYVATADRDGRVRVSCLPAEPLKGAHEIQTYCMGHKNFVTSAVFATAADPSDTTSGESLLVTGSGDGSVRVWNAESGALLSTYIAAAPRTTPAAEEAAAVAAEESSAGQGAQDGQSEQEAAAGEGAEASEGAGEQEEEGAEGEEEGVQGGGDGGEEGVTDRSDTPDCAAVLCVALSRDKRTLAVLVEGEQDIQVLSMDPVRHQLALAQRLSLPTVAYPCRADWDAAGRLWVVGGPPSAVTSSVHLAVLALKDGQLSEVTRDVVSEEVRGKLERRDAEEEAKLAAGELDLAPRKPMFNRKYENQDPSRKRPRNDLKENLRLAAMRAKQPSAQ